MSSLTPHTAKALAVALLAAVLPVLASVEADLDGLTDAELELPGDITVQLCDYPQRDGGLSYHVHRALREHGEITGIEELGSARCVPALVTLLRRVLPTAAPAVPA